MHRRKPLPHRANRLQLERLEDRENPSGVVNASLAAGVLTLTGDDNNNNITIQVTGTGATITPNDGETINVIGSLTGTVKSINAVMKGGNDTVTIDTALTLIGGAVFNLGSGNNSLNLGTGAVPINIGGNLAIKGGDGLDNVIVDGNGVLLSKVTGGVNLALGVGGSNVTVQDIDVHGLAGVKLSAGEGADNFSLMNVAIPTGGVSVAGGAGTLGVNLIGSNDVARRVTVIGGISTSVSVSSGAYGSLDINSGPLGYTSVTLSGSATVNGAMSVRGFNANMSLFAGNLTTGSLIFAGNASASLSDLFFGGSISVVRNMSVSAQGTISLGLNFSGLSVGGDLSMSSPSAAVVSLGNVATVTGNFTVTGGTGNDSVTTNVGALRVGNNVVLDLKGGDNTVNILGGGPSPTAGGNMSILAGAGRDTVTLDDTDVEGTLNMRLGAGADTLTMIDGVVVGLTTFVDLGGGDDLLKVAQVSGSAVTLTGKATLLTGAGNDSVTLGVSEDATRLLNLGPPGGVLSLGLGLDTYVPTNSNITGGVLTVLDPP